MSSHEINIPQAATISKVKVVKIFHGPSFSSYYAVVDIIKLTRDVVAAFNAIPHPYLLLCTAHQDIKHAHKIIFTMQRWQDHALSALKWSENK